MHAVYRTGKLIAQSVLRPSVIAAGIALGVCVVTGIFAERQNRTVHFQRERVEVSERLGQVRAKLEGNINANIQLVRGLVALIAAQPDIGQEDFGRIGEGLIGEHSQIRNVAAAPDLVISMMYPMAGNEKAIGLDYRRNEAQREAAMRAVESREMILAGPVDLLQGGQGFIGRFPVFYEDSAGRSKLWGIVSGVVDVEQLYRESGLLAEDLPIEIAISGHDALGIAGATFFGDAAIFGANPVVTEVSLPSGNWRMAAIPRGGWSAAPENVWQLRALILLAGLLIVGPISVSGHLYDQRRAHLRRLHRSKQQLQHMSERLSLALNTSRIGVWELNLDTGVMTWDERMHELYGVPRHVKADTYEVWSKAVHPEDRARAEQEFHDAIEAGGTYASEFRVIQQDGTVRWIRAYGAVHDDEGGPRHIIGANWDVSADISLKTSLLEAKKSAEQRNRELEDARAQMEHNSLHDSLTGLPNRRYLDQLLEGGEGIAPTALLHIDLDRFKHINDTLGHAAGDHMLVHAAKILKRNTRDDEFVARIGGDEFVIAITGEIDEDGLGVLANRIIEQMRQPVTFENHECRYGVSIGIAVADTREQDYGRRLLVDADIALYRAKSNGRNRFEFFSSALKAEIVRSKRIADHILNGLERQEFHPHFQPQFDARTLEVAGVEALARWAHPDEGLLAPDSFLRTAEEFNVVPLIDRAILEQALWQASRWRSAGIDIPRLSVNVSAGRLHDAGLMDTLDGLDIAPGAVSFELLESIFLDERNETFAANFDRLKALGIDIEIDDFGTGYASIISLINLRPSRLKVDRRLVFPIVEDENQARLVGSIIDIGHSLGIQVVAEGVETMRHAAILRELGCDILQGYAFARPMPSDELMRFVREERWRKVA